MSRKVFIARRGLDDLSDLRNGWKATFHQPYSTHSMVLSMTRCLLWPRALAGARAAEREFYYSSECGQPIGGARLSAEAAKGGHMYVVANSPECLRLRESYGLVPAVLGGAAVALGIFAVSRHFDRTLLINAGIAAVAAIFFRRESRVTLDKPARRCGIWRRDMWRKSYRAIAFDDITDVRVEIQTPDTSAQTHSRLAVMTPDGAVPLTAGFGPGLDNQIRIREAMVDMIFAGRGRPALIDPVQLLLDAGRPFAAERRA